MNLETFTPRNRPSSHEALAFYDTVVSGNFCGWEKRQRQDIEIWTAKHRKVKTILGTLPAEVMMTREGRSLINTNKAIRESLTHCEYTDVIGSGNEAIVYNLDGTNECKRYAVKQVYPTTHRLLTKLILFTPQTDQLLLLHYIANTSFMREHKYRINEPLIATTFQTVTPLLTDVVGLCEYTSVTENLKYNYSVANEVWNKTITRRISTDSLNKNIVQIVREDGEKDPEDKFLFQFNKSLKANYKTIEEWYRKNISNRADDLKRKLQLHSDIAQSHPKEMANNAMIDMKRVFQIYLEYKKSNKTADQFLIDARVGSLIENSIICIEAGVAGKKI